MTLWTDTGKLFCKILLLIKMIRISFNNYCGLPHFIEIMQNWFTLLFFDDVHWFFHGWVTSKILGSGSNVFFVYTLFSMGDFNVK